MPRGRSSQALKSARQADLDPMAASLPKRGANGVLVEGTSRLAAIAAADVRKPPADTPTLAAVATHICWQLPDVLAVLTYCTSPIYLNVSQIRRRIAEITQQRA